MGGGLWPAAHAMRGFARVLGADIPPGQIEAEEGRHDAHNPDSAEAPPPRLARKEGA